MNDTPDERRVAQLEEKLHRAQGALGRRAAELEEYSYTISHDLRAPLRHIEGYIELLRARIGGRLDSETDEILDRIAAAVRKMDQLTQDVLIYGQIGREQIWMGPIELDALVPELIDRYPACRKAQILVVRPLLGVVGNSSLIGQIVANLLDNAIKFVPKDRVAVVEISTERRSAKVRIIVKDNGIGVDAELHGKIFKPFERAPEAKDYPGHGIGLAIVKKAAERMGGRVGVDSVRDKGSRFWVELRGEFHHEQNHPRR